MEKNTQKFLDSEYKVKENEKKNKEKITNLVKNKKIKFDCKQVDTNITCTIKPQSFPAQHQNQHPGIESKMDPLPIFDNPNYKGSNKLQDKVALITGGDSGIGRAVAVAFAKEGCDVAIVYLEQYEYEDAKKTETHVKAIGRKCLLLQGDLKKETFCNEVIQYTLNHLGKLDILVLNHGVQYPHDNILDISAEQIQETFQTNIISYFYLTKAALPHLKKGSSIISTASITAYKGTEKLIDYSATKGAVVSFTRSLSLQLASKGIRVNAVAPGATWSPLIVSSYDAEYVSTFGTDSTMIRAGQPFELAPTYVYLASEDSSFVSGQVLHVNGGVIVDS